MVTREFSGKSKEELMETILNTLKVGEDKLTIEFVEEGSILPFMKKKVTAKVSYEEENSFGNRSLIFVRDLLEKMNIEAKIYLIEENDEKTVIEIESPDSALIIGKKGNTLESLQTIVNIVMNKSANVWTKVLIDVGNYRDRREKSLESMAKRAASQVRKTGRSMLLEPMNPFERRIVHMTLKDLGDIETQSEGEGMIKSIRVSVLKKE